MKLRKIILKSFALFLLLILLQKSGIGLLLHNSKHEEDEKKEFPPDENKKRNTVNYSCSCLDEFLTPFTEAEKLIFSNPAINTPILNVTYKKGIPSGSSLYFSLRGPPIDLM